MATDLEHDVEDALEEVYWGDILPLLAGERRKEIRSEWDLFDMSGPGSPETEKSLPYHDQPSLDLMQRVGYRLWRDTNVQPAIKTLATYVVFKGWWYAVSVRQGQEYPEKKLALIKATHADLLERVGLGVQHGWFYLQRESYIRYLRDGEFFRRWWVMPDGTLQVRFIEVGDIRQPKSIRSIVNLDSLPAEVLAQFNVQGEEIPGVLGIVSAAGDAATEIGYWYRQDRTEEMYRYLPAARVQHAKCDVDANDPRGVPAFYDAVCHSAQAGDVTEAMNELAVKQSQYAVVKKHKATNRREAIQGLVASRTREMNDQMSSGRGQAETHLKNVDIEMHAMKAQGRNYVEVIQQDQRNIGALRQIPEFMITNDANTGNRSSLLAASSPFGRRVATDQKDMWFYDQELQWQAIVSLLNWQVATAVSARRRVQIAVTFPLSDEKDPLKESRRLVDLREDGVISRQQQRRLLDIDHQQMQSELAEEGGIEVSPNKMVKKVESNDPQIPTES